LALQLSRPQAKLLQLPHQLLHLKSPLLKTATVVAAMADVMVTVMVVTAMVDVMDTEMVDVTVTAMAVAAGSVQRLLN
jgi:hypothetical protein